MYKCPTVNFHEVTGNLQQRYKRLYVFMLAFRLQFSRFTDKVLLLAVIVCALNFTIN